MSRDSQAHIHKEICIKKFTAVLFIKAVIWSDWKFICRVYYVAWVLYNKILSVKMKELAYIYQIYGEWKSRFQGDTGDNTVFFM